LIAGYPRTPRRALGRRLTGAAAFLLTAFTAFAWTPGEPIPVPKLTAYVVDLTGALTIREREALSSRAPA
jgi:uncharacterized membrane protein YgcG